MSKARELAELGAVYDSGALSNRNILMNGAQVISQRGTSALTASASSDTFITDRFRISNYSTCYIHWSTKSDSTHRF